MEVTPESTILKVTPAGYQNVPQSDGSVIRYMYFKLLVDSNDANNNAQLCEEVNGQMMPWVLKSEGIMIQRPRQQIIH